MDGNVPFKAYGNGDHMSRLLARRSYNGVVKRENFGIDSLQWLVR